MDLRLNMLIRYAMDTTRSRNGPTAGYFYFNNEFSVYIKQDKFIEYLSDYRTQKKILASL